MGKKSTCAIGAYFPPCGNSHHYPRWSGSRIGKVPIPSWLHRALKHELLLIFGLFFIVGVDLLAQMLGVNVICIRAVSYFCAVDDTEAECLKHGLQVSPDK